MKIVLLALNGNLPSGLVGLADVFWLAGKASELQPDAPRWPFEVIIASPDGRAVSDGRSRPLLVGLRKLGTRQRKRMMIIRYYEY